MKKKIKTATFVKAERFNRLFSPFDAPAEFKPIKFGEALNISLADYYDLLKNQMGGLGSEEYLQLKVASDGIDIADNPSDYEWWSRYTLAKKCDLQITPNPISGEINTGAATLTSVYEDFLNVLSSLVEINVLDREQQAAITTINNGVKANKEAMQELSTEDVKNWRIYANQYLLEENDAIAYFHWRAEFGNAKLISDLVEDNMLKEFNKRKILDSLVKDPDDKIIIKAQSMFSNPQGYFHYPTMPDQLYGQEGGKNKIDAVFLSKIPMGTSVYFEEMHPFSLDKSLDTLKHEQLGTITGHFEKKDQENHSIETDWKASVSVGWSFIKVKGTAENVQKIQDEFKNALTLDLSSTASIRANIIFGPWFNADLFEHKKIKDNPELFKRFFGPKGSLLYYPTSLILIRGFSIRFTNQSNWLYDYQNSFSSSLGANIACFGIGFGGAGQYSKIEQNHTVQSNGTVLEIADGPGVIRFVGYIVKKNTVLEDLEDNDKPDPLTFFDSVQKFSKANTVNTPLDNKLQFA